MTLPVINAAHPPCAQRSYKRWWLSVGRSLTAIFSDMADLIKRFLSTKPHGSVKGVPVRSTISTVDSR